MTNYFKVSKGDWSETWECLKISEARETTELIKLTGYDNFDRIWAPLAVWIVSELNSFTIIVIMYHLVPTPEPFEIIFFYEIVFNTM
jgi:hypothetical protein